MQLEYAYPEKTVLLDIYLVTDFSGEPHGAEGQPLAWVAPRDLDQYDSIHRECLARLPGVSSMRSSFSLRRIKQMRGYPVRSG